MSEFSEAIIYHDLAIEILFPILGVDIERSQYCADSLMDLIIAVVKLKNKKCYPWEKKVSLDEVMQKLNDKLVSNKLYSIKYELNRIKKIPNG